MIDTHDLSAEADDAKLLAQVVNYYHQTLKDHAEVLEYLHGRGLRQAQAIEQFRIGFCDRTLCLKLPPKQVKAGRDIRGRLHALGVLRSSGHEQFRGSITFPILAADGTGRIVDMYGHKRVSVHLRKGTPLEVFLGEERRGVWNVEAFAATEEIILCSSLWDALSFWSHGYRNVTCTFGPDALTDDHLAALREFKIQRVLLVAESIAPRLLEAGIECFKLKLPVGMDVNTYALQVSAPADALGAVIRKAEWIGKATANAEPTSVPATAEPEAVETVAVDVEAICDPPANTETALASITSADTDQPPACDLSPVATSPTVAAPTGRTESPLPPPPAADPEAKVRDDEVEMTFGTRRYRVRGWGKNLSFDQLKINLLVSAEQGLFVDTFDLYSAKYRRAFIVQAAQELDIDEQTIKKDVGHLLLKLEELQDKRINEALTPKDPTPEMSDDEKSEALRLLRDPQLLDRITADVALVGERANKLLCYLAAVSRKLDQPLAVVVQSSSAAGKTALMESVLALVPAEDQIKFSAMTGQALFYMGESNLKHKILAIVEEEGAQRASYALKLLQSEGELRIASTGKDADSGRMVTQEYRVQGPVMIFMTTTAIKVDEELLNRCLVLTVDEDREQTRAIHQLQRQRQTLAGLLSAKAHDETLALHRNAQRLLRPLLVANPFAERLTFLDDKTRTRRDHVKYLTLIRAVALLHQYQRPIRTIEHQGQPVEYIDVAIEDIEIANRLANEVLGRSVDDLPPQTRRLLELIDAMVTAACSEAGMDREDFHFTRRDVREFTGWGHTQLKVHLRRLEELEYLLAHQSTRGQSRVYELLFDASTHDGQRFLAKIIDAARLRATTYEYDAERSGQNGQWSGPGRPLVGGVSGGGRGQENDASGCCTTVNGNCLGKGPENAHLE